LAIFWPTTKRSRNQWVRFEVKNDYRKIERKTSKIGKNP
jgi:hypothetical protein